MFNSTAPLVEVANGQVVVIPRAIVTKLTEPQEQGNNRYSITRKFNRFPSPQYDRNPNKNFEF
jgi:hypothetical protein